MHRSALLVVLFAGLARAQAVAPLLEPVVEPAPSFPTPGATPAGAGASHGMLPTTEQELAPRSPNRRMLPPMKEPGLWAADEVKASTEDRPAPDIAGIPLPQPSAVARKCANVANKALQEAKNAALLAQLQEADRRCVAAQMFLYCAESAATQRPDVDYLPKLQRMDAADLERERLAKKYKDDVAQGKKFAYESCREAPWTPAMYSLLQGIKRPWPLQLRGN